MYFITHRKIFFGIGVAIMAASIAIIFSFGLRLGIDFAGGSLMEVSYTERPLKEAVTAKLDTLALGGYSLRETDLEEGKSGYILRTRDLTDAERQQVEMSVTEEFGGEVDRFTSIGPVIGQELRDKAVWAIGGVVLIIVLYVAFAFRGVREPVGSWVYGGITIFALIHDVLVPTALMSLLGYFFGIEIDVLFVMALLAVLGYSVNDTIVVFDRVRENLMQYRQEKKEKQKVAGVESVKVTYLLTKPFNTIIGQSVIETLMRSINTSCTTLLALLALYFFGGESTQTFALVLIAGVIAGAYSSVCIANPMLALIAERKEKKTSA